MFFIQIPLEIIKDGVLYFLITTAILATIFYRKYSSTFLKYFLPLIWIELAIELFGPYYSEHINHNNTIIFNIYRLIEFTFYFLLYHHLVTKPQNKKLISIFLVIYCLTVIINCFIEDFRFQYFSNTYFIGASLIIISIVLYFSEILNSEKIIIITRMFSFWISIAVFIYYVTSIPFKVIVNYYQDSSTIPYIYAFNYAVVFIFYLIISIGLFWSKKE